MTWVVQAKHKMEFICRKSIRSRLKYTVLLPLTIDLRVSGAPFTVTMYSLEDEPGFCKDTMADIRLRALEKWCRWAIRIETRLPLLGITISPAIQTKWSKSHFTLKNNTNKQHQGKVLRVGKTSFRLSTHIWGRYPRTWKLQTLLLQYNKQN